MSNAIIKIDQIPNFVKSLETQFNNLVHEHNAVKFSQECNYALQALRANDFLMKIASQNSESLQNAIYNVAAIGITLSPAEKLSYLIPRKGKIILEISYMGLSRLATNSRSILFVTTELVCVNDKEFKLNGPGERATHVFDCRGGDRGAIEGAYCTIKTREGDFLVDYMTIDEIYKARDRSSAWDAHINKGKSCPWVTDENEMIKKTVVKRASKLWPKTDKRLDDAIHMLNETEGIDFEKERRGEPCSKNQLKQINELIFDMKKIDEVAFKKYLSSEAKTKIEEYSELSTSEAEKAISLLIQKRDAETKKAKNNEND